LSVSTVFGAETAAYASSQARKDDHFSGAHLSFVHLSATTPYQQVQQLLQNHSRQFVKKLSLLRKFSPKMAGQGDDDVAKQEYKMSGEWV